MRPSLDLSNKKLHGKYTLNGGLRSGENVTLWLGIEDVGEDAFYLEFGFYGDDGGKTHVYEGTYIQQNDQVILNCNKETWRKWDDSVDDEELTEKSSKVKIEGNIIFHGKNLSIELLSNSKIYSLKKLEVL